MQANFRIKMIFQLLNFRYKFILENNENASFYLGTNSLGEKSRRETKHGNDDIQLRKDQRTEGGRDELSITKYHIKSYGSLSYIAESRLGSGAVC